MQSVDEKMRVREPFRRGGVHKHAVKKEPVHWKSREQDQQMKRRRRRSK